MKPCSQHKKSIAWLALDALDAQDSTALRAHFADCEGCRAYFEQLSNITEKLASTAPDSSLEASEQFHRGVARKLRLTQSSSTFENLSTWFRNSILTWRVALPAISALIIALALLLSPRPHPTVQLAPPLAQVIPSSNLSRDLPPTIANYQKVANQSLEDLSDLLTKQGSKSLPPAPLYTASGLNLSNTPN